MDRNDTTEHFSKSRTLLICIYYKGINKRKPSSLMALNQEVTLSSETYSAPCPGGCLDGGAG